MTRLIFTLTLLCCSTSWGWVNAFGVDRGNPQLEELNRLQAQQVELQKQMLEQQRQQLLLEQQREAQQQQQMRQNNYGSREIDWTPLQNYVNSLH